MSRRLAGIAAGESVGAQFLVDLKGKLHPAYGGILDLATRLGLVSLTTRVLQVPHEANGQMAVVMATAVFDDGTTFEDVGDCSPKSTSPQMATAALRMAATRAKARAMRDACNVGQQTAEEAEGREGRAGQSSSPAARRPPAAPRARPATQGGPPVCSYPECGCILSQKENAVSRKLTGKPWCSAHLGRAEQALQHKLAAHPAA